MENKKLEINQSEAEVLLKLIDLAVKSGGIQVAEAAVVLSKKIATLFEVKNEVKEEVKETKDKK